MHTHSICQPNNLSSYQGHANRGTMCYSNDCATHIRNQLHTLLGIFIKHDILNYTKQVIMRLCPGFPNKGREMYNTPVNLKYYDIFLVKEPIMFLNGSHIVLLNKT